MVRACNEWSSMRRGRKQRLQPIHCGQVSFVLALPVRHLSDHMLAVSVSSSGGRARPHSLHCRALAWPLQAEYGH